MISEETTRSLHMIEGPIGLLLNLLALYLIAKKSKNMGGKYPHLLFAFCSCNLTLIVIDMLTLPANLVSGQTYLLFAHRTVLGDRQLTYWLLLAYCCAFAQTLVLLMFQFMYRYSIVDSTLWTLDVHIFNNAVTADPAPSQNPHYIRTYLVTIFLVVILGCTWNIIILAGYKIYRLLSENVMASKTTKRLQKELFHALVIQLLIPLFCSYIPRAIIGWFRKTKEEPVATISNTSQSGPISTTKRHPKMNETNPLTN
ncbi:unnamed protein product, partial [Mesorhabditis spiculigera]